jgi:hypothetical protein
MSQKYTFLDVNGRKHTFDPNAIGGGSQTPILSDIDYAGFSLTNALILRAQAHEAFSGIDTTSYNFDEIRASSGNSTINLHTGDPAWGFQNGEPAGVGADVNLVSVNGNVVVTGTEIDLVSSGLISITGQVNIDGLISSISGSALSLMDDATFGIHNMEPPGVGSDINFISDNGGVVISPKLLVGATVDDGTSAPIQSGGDISASTSYWCSVRQGGSGFYVLDADGVTTHEIVGGIVMN